MPRLPHALAPSALAAIRERLAAASTAVFLLDYDGTLAPIVPDPARAQLQDGMAAALAALRARFPRTAVITGRSVAKARAFLGDAAIQLAASHGHDLDGPWATRAVGDEHLPALAAARDALSAALAGIPGASVEDNRFSVTVHLRRVPPERVDEVRGAVGAFMAAEGSARGLLVRPGNAVLEVRPAMAWGKGAAAGALLAALGLRDDPAAVCVAIGDDATDEDMFAALCGGGGGEVDIRAAGIPIVVWGGGALVGAGGGGDDGGGAPAVDVGRPTAAKFALRSPAEVRDFLLACAETPVGGGTEQERQAQAGA